MSERLLIAILFAAAAHAAPHTAAAQGVSATSRTASGLSEREALQARIAAMRDSVAASKQRRDAIRQARRSDPTDTILVDGILLHYPGRQLSARDLAALREGIGRARTAIDTRFGAGTASLLDGDRWSLTFTQIFGSVPGTGKRQLTFVGNGGSGGVTLTLPLEASRVAAYTEDRAGWLLHGLHPVIRDFVGGTVTMRAPSDELYEARRAMATSKSSVAQRCASGVLAACRVLFDPSRKAEWFDPGDVQSGEPISKAVRGTLLLFALERRRGQAVAALRESGKAEDKPLDAIARVAGLPADTLLMEWNAAMRQDAERRAGLGVPMIATTILWAGLCVTAAVSRRAIA